MASLSWGVRRGGRVFSGRPEQRLRAGDAVRFVISAREPVYVAILGLDAVGQPSVYFPEGEQLARIEAGRDQPLPAAIELDAAPAALRLYAVRTRASAKACALATPWICPSQPARRPRRLPL